MRPFLIALACSAIVLPGCQQQSGDNGPAVPPAASATTAQEAGSAVESLSLSSSIATDAILSAGAGQTVETSSSESAKSTSAVSSSASVAAASGFSFATSGTVTVDLDTLATGGGDRYPNATGTFSVAYDSSGSGGPVVGSPVGGAGIVAYSVTVTALSDCTFTDPRCSAATTIAAGSSYHYEVEITWNWTDANHWTLQSDVDLTSSGLSGNGTRAATTWSASLSGARHALNVLSYNTGALSLTRTVTGDWTINTVKNGIPHVVVWHRPALDRIFITVDGTTYGPYTVGQVWWYWQMSCH
ncbi:MAG TPA: hypothetical protein VHX44_02750 [Planctomycetota bacterium]|nr:hypothetical protein [Planctomycetota bacterium]